MEFIILSLGLLFVTFWTYFSDLFGKLARIIIATLFLGLAFCAIAVVIYLDSFTISFILLFAAVVVFIDMKRVYDNYGYCDDPFKLFNMEIVKVSIMVLCMCLISQYATIFRWFSGGGDLVHSLFNGDVAAKIFYCLAMTGLVAIVDASKQTKIYAGFEPGEDDLILTGYVVGYEGKTYFGKSKLVLEVDLDEYKRQSGADTAENYGPIDNHGNFDGLGRFVKYDGFGRRKRFRRSENVQAANTLSSVRPSQNGSIVYFVTAMRYDKDEYPINTVFLVNYSDAKHMLYVMDEMNSNKQGITICASLGFFAFITCLTYFVRNL